MRNNSVHSRINAAQTVSAVSAQQPCSVGYIQTKIYGHQVWPAAMDLCKINSSDISPLLQVPSTDLYAIKCEPIAPYYFAANRPSHVTLRSLALSRSPLPDAILPPTRCIRCVQLFGVNDQTARSVTRRTSLTRLPCT